MFRSTIIIRELVQSLAKVIFMLKPSVKLRRYIHFYIFPTRCNFTQFIYLRKTAVHVSGGIFTHHQEHI